MLYYNVLLEEDNAEACENNMHTHNNNNMHISTNKTKLVKQKQQYMFFATHNN